MAYLMLVIKQKNVFSALMCISKGCVAVIFAVLISGINAAHAQNYQYKAQSGSVGDWVLDSESTTDTEMFTVLDRLSSSRVMTHKGRIFLNFTQINNKNKVGSVSKTSGINTSVIRWMYKTDKPFKFEYIVETNKGSRAIVYSHLNEKRPRQIGLTIFYGLGEVSISNRWIHVIRDLQKDLQRVDPEIKIVGVKQISISGEGLLRELEVQQPLFKHSETNRTEPKLAAALNALENSIIPLSTQNALIVDPAINISNDVLSDEKTVKAFSLKPYVVAGRNSYNRVGEFETESTYAGFSGDYFSGDSLHMFLDVLPDFSLVEEKLNDIDFDYNEKEREDPREFFEENTSFFNQELDYFYSLRLPDFNYGFKTLVDTGATQVGALAVISADDRKDTHIRYSYGFEESNRFSVDGVASSQEGLEHQLIGVTLNHAFANQFYVNMKGSAAQNKTIEDDFQGGAGSVDVGWASDTLSFSVLSDYYDKDYNPSSAFLNADRPGTRGTTLNGSYYKAGAGRYRDFTASASFNQRNTLSGDQQNEGGVISLGALLFGKAQVQLDFNKTNYRPLSDEQGVFIDEVNNDEFWSAKVDVTNSATGYGVSYSDGNLAGGEYRYRSSYFWFKPINKLSFTLFNERLISFGEFTQNSVEADWQINKRQNLRAKYSNGDNFQQWRLGYQHDFTRRHKVYIAYQKLTETDDELIGKFSWILQ